jgi:hypothetical protein
VSEDPFPAGACVDATLQRALYEGTALRVRAVVGQFTAEHEAALRQLPCSVVHDLVADLVVAYLIGVGAVRYGLPPDEPVRVPGEWRDRVPEQLLPDVARVLGGYQRLLSELGDAAGT